MKVYLLHDGIYEHVLSVHATRRGVKKAMRKHLDGEVTEQAKRWWDDFGVGGRHHHPSHDHPGSAKTLEQHIEDERQATEKSFWIQEFELE